MSPTVGQRLHLGLAGGGTVEVTVCPGGGGCNSLVPSNLLAEHLADWHGLTDDIEDSDDAQTVSY